MTNDSSKSPEWAATRHRLFPKTVCLAHLVFYNEPLCPQLRKHGLKICEDHAKRIARALGWKRPKDWQELRKSGRALQMAQASEDRVEIGRLNRENRELRAEIVRLKDMTPAQRRAEQRTNDGTVYALLSGYNVKVGWTGRDLQERLREYPPSTTLLVHFPGKRGDETRIKRKFAHLRTHGAEWFPYAPQVTEWVEQMVAQHGDPDPNITCGPAKYQVPRPHAQKPVPRPKATRWHVS